MSELVQLILTGIIGGAVVFILTQLTIGIRSNKILEAMENGRQEEYERIYGNKKDRQAAIDRIDRISKFYDKNNCE